MRAAKLWRAFIFPMIWAQDKEIAARAKVRSLAQQKEEAFWGRVSVAFMLAYWAAGLFLMACFRLI
jgi:hypothetical protein